MSIFSYIQRGISRQQNHEIDFVVDIGTASISAVFATSLSGNDVTQRYEVGTIFNKSFNLLTFSHGAPEARAWHVVQTALSKLFADAVASRVRPRRVRISVASLFFKEVTVQKTVARVRADYAITLSELDSLREESKKEVIAGQDMVIIRDRILQCTINGYTVIDPLGYTGETLQCTFQFLFISQLLHKHIAELLERYFPAIPVTYYSDADVLVALAEFTSSALPALIMDIGGEATSCYALQAGQKITYHPPIYFGVRTLERRIAATMHGEVEEAESLLRRFTAQTLHEGEWEKIQPTLEGALKDWWILVSKEVPAMKACVSLLIAGAGRDMVFFTDTIQKQAPSIFSVAPDHIHSLQLPEDLFVPKKAFGFGGDMILGGLVLIDKHESFHAG